VAEGYSLLYKLALLKIGPSKKILSLCKLDGPDAGSRPEVKNVLGVLSHRSTAKSATKDEFENVVSLEERVNIEIIRRRVKEVYQIHAVLLPFVVWLYKKSLSVWSRPKIYQESLILP
jgi:hypothetical protein